MIYIHFCIGFAYHMFIQVNSKQIHKQKQKNTSKNVAGLFTFQDTSISGGSNKFLLLR